MLISAFDYAWWAGAVAVTAIVLAAIYVLWMYQRTMTGPPAPATRRSPTSTAARSAPLAPLVLALVLFGFYPMPLLDVINPTVETTLQHVGVTDDAPSSRPRHRPRKATSERLRQAHHRVRRAVAAAGRLRRGLPRRDGRGVPAAPPPLRRPDVARRSSAWSVALVAVAGRRGPPDRSATAPPAAWSAPRGRSPSTVRPSSCGAWCWSSPSAASCSSPSASSRAASPPSRARPPRSPAPRPSVRRPPRVSTTPRSIPLLMFAVGGHDAVPRLQ